MADIKVVILGNIIPYESAAKKEKMRRLVEIEKALPSLETAYQTSKSSDDNKEILKLKYEYNSLLDFQINKLLLRLRQTQFKLGDKPKRLLAAQGGPRQKEQFTVLNPRQAPCFQTLKK